jgi:predicted amidohydrolase
MINSKINVALAQIAPVWLDKEATLDKILKTLKAAKEKKQSSSFLERHYCLVIHFGLR